MFLQNLCAMRWTNYLVDVVLALVLVGYVVYCSKRGFIDCLFGFFSTIIAFLAAIFLAKTLVRVTGGLFGLRGVLDRSFTRAFMRMDGLDTHVVGESTVETLKNSGVSTILAKLVLKMTKGAQDGTLLAEALGDVTSALAIILLCGVIIFILIKVLLRFLKGSMENAAQKIKIIGAANTLLGAFAGLIGFTLLISTVLAVLAFFPMSSVSNAIERSIVVGFLFKYNPLVWLIGWLL